MLPTQLGQADTSSMTITTTNGSKHAAQVEAASISPSSNISTGPITAAGKVSSSMNSIQHGLASRGVLLPSEKAEDYEANLNSWLSTLRPESPVEAQVVTRISDASFRLERLSRLEQKHVQASLEKQLNESRHHQALVQAQEARQGLMGLAGLAESVTGAADGGAVAKLLPAISKVLELVGKVDLQLSIVAPLGAAP